MGIVVKRQANAFIPTKIREGRTMQFQPLENASPLEIIYSGERLDLYTLGIFQLQMQDVIDKVTLGLLSQAGLIEPTWRRAKYLPRTAFPASDRFIRAEIRELGAGSLTEAVTFAVATVVADPNVIAILQDLAANVVWAIGVSGVRGIRNRLHRSPNDFRWFGRDDDPLEIGPNLRPILVALAENNQLRRAELRFKGRTRHGEEVEAEIIIEGGERPR